MDENNITGLTERFMYDIEAYLASKIPDIPEHEAQEISAYISNRFVVSMLDIVLTRDREWVEFHSNEIKRMGKVYQSEIDRRDVRKRKE